MVYKFVFIFKKKNRHYCLTFILEILIWKYVKQKKPCLPNFYDIV